MDFREYKELVKTIKVGKQLPDAVYLHESALDVLPAELVPLLINSIHIHSLKSKEWNIIKFFKRDYKFTLLNYPTFFEDPYPALKHAYTVDLEGKKYRESDYANSDNPPILHRKETLLKANHPRESEFKELTKEAEEAGLYVNPKIIGFRKSWERLISRKGYALDSNGRLQPKCDQYPTNIAELETDEIVVERHRTAIDRDKLSVPMQLLARHNYLNGEFSVFDYGCGKGDDVLELEAHGNDVTGWDPVHSPHTEKTTTDIVNLGYVINVIEDRTERDQVLLDAFTHCKKILAVSAMLASSSLAGQFKPYKDGVITSRNTFQKYFQQSELRSYLENTLDRNSIAVAPGIFFVFKDELEEQIFLSERQHIRRNWRKLSQRERSRPKETSLNKELYDRNSDLFDDFWNNCLDLGRVPANNEYDYSQRIRSVIGSHSKAFNILKYHYDYEVFEKASQARSGDLLVYFALSLFGKSRPYIHMPEGLKRDIKIFFGNYKEVLKQATSLLFSVGDPSNIESACQQAYEILECGELIEGHSLTIHRSFIEKLPPILRTYIGCATQLYGDIEDFDLIKLHTSSGKVSLMRYDDFYGNAIPLLQERIKINLREQDIDFFDYDGEEYLPQPLYLRSRYITPDKPNYQEQVNFDATLSGLGLFDLSGFGPSSDVFYEVLKQNSISIIGFELVRNA